MIHVEWFGERDDRAPIVVLHEGLGSVSAWGGFPERLAATSGRAVMAYDRAGYGRSDPRPGPWPVSFMHDEAAALVDVLAEQGIDRPILFGHSDGASIALLYPSCGVPLGGPPPLGIISLSAHVLVEPICVEAIERLRREADGGLVRALSRHHDDAAATFEAWSEVWVSDRFRPWAIDDELAAVECPVVAVQGAADGFGTPAQLDRLAAAVSGPVEAVLVPDVDHWPHREAPDRVLALTNDLLRGVNPRE
ncbi:MAG: alpha/beta hydrolase [Actinomycetota bacterium]